MLMLRANVQLTTGDTILIECDNFPTFQQTLMQLQAIGALPSAPQDSAPPTGMPIPAPAAPPPQPAETETKPPKNTKAAKKEEPKAEEPKGPTIDDVSAFITELANTISLSAARELLGRHGVKRAKELDPKDYADVIAEAQYELRRLGSGDDGGEADIL